MICKLATIFIKRLKNCFSSFNRHNHVDVSAFSSFLPIGTSKLGTQQQKIMWVVKVSRHFQLSDSPTGFSLLLMWIIGYCERQKNFTLTGIHSTWNTFEPCDGFLGVFVLLRRITLGDDLENQKTTLDSSLLWLLYFHLIHLEGSCADGEVCVCRQGDHRSPEEIDPKVEIVFERLPLPSGVSHHHGVVRVLE